MVRTEEHLQRLQASAYVLAKERLAPAAVIPSPDIVALQMDDCGLPTISLREAGSHAATASSLRVPDRGRRA